MADVTKIFTSLGQNDDLGFGTKASGRLVNKKGEYNVERIGKERYNAYQQLIKQSWWLFFVQTIIYYLSINVAFGLILTWTGKGTLSFEYSESFWFNFSKSLFFSIQTFTTVGYGGIVPVSLTGNIIASLIAFFGLLTFSIVTGISFARFARPESNIRYSSVALITDNLSNNSLQFRLVNSKGANVLELEAQVSMSWIEKIEGMERRRFYQLKLERDKIFAFPLNWNVVHYIDENSPLNNVSYQELKERKTEFIILIKGYDELFMQHIHSIMSYTMDEILWNKKFAPMYDTNSKTGVTRLFIDKINEVLDA